MAPPTNAHWSRRPPSRAGRILEFAQRLGSHCDAEPRSLRCDVTSVLDLHRIEEVLVEVLDVFEHPVLERSTDGDVVEQRYMLHVLAESYSACVGADRNPELCSHQEHREHFIHPSQPAGVELAEDDCVRLKQLLEEDAILAVLA